VRVTPRQVIDFIDKRYPGAKTGSHHALDDLRKDEQPYLEVILDLISHLPPELVVLTPDDQLRFLIATAGIRAYFKKWLNHDNKLGTYAGLDNKHVVVVIREVLSSCPEEAPTKGAAPLPFIRDRVFRRMLHLDISSAQRAFANGEWKAATVLAGSIIEALLLWKMSRFSKPKVQSAVLSAASKAAARGEKFIQPKKDDINEWKLSQMIPVAYELGCILERTSKQADLARNFRNLIHPSKATREGDCTQATANAALAGMYFVVEDLSKGSRR